MPTHGQVTNAMPSDSARVDRDPTNHYNTLAAIEELWNLGCLGQACGSASIASLFSH